MRVSATCASAREASRVGAAARRGAAPLRDPSFRRAVLQKKSVLCKSAPSRGLPAAAAATQGAQRVLVPRFHGFERDAAEHRSLDISTPAPPPTLLYIRRCLLPTPPRWTEGGFGDGALTCNSSPLVMGRAQRTAATLVAPRCWKMCRITWMMNAGPGWTSGAPHCFKTSHASVKVRPITAQLTATTPLLLVEAVGHCSVVASMVCKSEVRSSVAENAHLLSSCCPLSASMIYSVACGTAL